MKQTVTQAILVEGKYDAARLAGLVEATILTTDGFAIYKNKAMQAMLKRVARAQGLIILTDSDAAGFQIRHFVTGLVGAAYVLQAYVPALPGKERRKDAPGKEGLLGVEGVPGDRIVQGLQTALASVPQADTKPVARPILYSDLYTWGLSGRPDCAEKRRQFLQALGLPPRLSKKELLQVLNTLYTYDQLSAQVSPPQAGEPG
ncbi:MAG: DUF4093 domain-containing protein [Gemmiger sp.]|nr:DUF4093 domain-containing protein [Gemmiger sp.]